MALEYKPPGGIADDVIIGDDADVRTGRQKDDGSSIDNSDDEVYDSADTQREKKKQRKGEQQKVRRASTSAAAAASAAGGGGSSSPAAGAGSVDMGPGGGGAATKAAADAAKEYEKRLKQFDRLVASNLHMRNEPGDRDYYGRTAKARCIPCREFRKIGDSSGNWTSHIGNDKCVGRQQGPRSHIRRMRTVLYPPHFTTGTSRM